VIQWSSLQVWCAIKFTSVTKRFGVGSVATSAAWLATASWLARSFATASWLGTTCWLAAVVVMLLEHLREQAFQAALRSCAGIAAVVNDFATANWLARSFATASWLAWSFATTSWLAGCFATAGWLAAIAAMLVEQAMKEALLLRCTSGITSASWLATASWLAGCFATASRLASSFAAACWLYVTTRVTTLVTQFVKQAERASVGGARSNHCDCHQSRNDYTTHRDISMELGTGEGFARLEPQHVRAANGQR